MLIRRRLHATRDSMLKVRNNSQNRLIRHNNGRKYRGPLNLKARKFLYMKLKELEEKIGTRVVSTEDERMIHILWGKNKGQ